jgi:hypothetical protein
MTEGFLKLVRGEPVKWLMANHPWAYLLLNLIALRACRSLPNSDGLEIGEALIGDWEAIGATRGQYRHAIIILQKENHIKIIETNRNRKKATNGTTTRGTKVKFISSTIWDTNPETNNHCNNHRTTTEQPLNNHEEEVKKIRSKEKEEEDNAQSAAPLRSKDSLSFDFQKWEFVGITEQDIADWKAIYPHIDIQVEKTKATQWLKNNPSKNNKKLWRKYLTGWFGRANDSTENKKAYRASAGGALQDRRTKDIHGNPVESPHTGRF